MMLAQALGKSYEVEKLCGCSLTSFHTTDDLFLANLSQSILSRPSLLLGLQEAQISCGWIWLF